MIVSQAYNAKIVDITASSWIAHTKSVANLEGSRILEQQQDNKP